MNWFDDIEQNTLLKIELDNSKEIIIYFIGVSTDIVEGKLKNGKIKRFRKDKIVDIEEIDNEEVNRQINISSEISTQASNVLNNTIRDQQQTDNTEEKAKIKIKTSFLSQIDNSILTKINFTGKNDFLEFKIEEKDLYKDLMAILNQFHNAKKINELDFKFGRSQKIIKQLDSILQNKYFDVVDQFLAYVFQEADESYFLFFKKLSEYKYCLQHDIYFFDKKNNQYSFIVVEKLFTLYMLDDDLIDQWFYFIKKFINYHSLKVIIYQNSIYHLMKNKHKDIFNTSLNYIFLKSNIDCNSTNKNIMIKTLEHKLEETEEYNTLDFVDDIASFDNKTNNFIENKSKRFDLEGNTFSSMGESFLEIMKPELDKELNKFLLPNGIIKTFYKHKDIGFIKTKNNIEYFFHINNIIDKKLRKEILTNKNIEVCFSISRNSQGEIADAIHKSKPIKDILDEVLNYDKDKAIMVLEQILQKYPDNIKVKQLYREINQKRKKYKKSTQDIKSSSGIFSKTYESSEHYRRAKDAKERKEYDTAIKYFNLAFENNEKIDSTIKDLTITYYESGDLESARAFLVQNEHKLTDSITSYNFLQNIYQVVGEYEKSIHYTNILLEDTVSVNREIALLGSKATSYIKLNNKPKAKEILEEILMLKKDNVYAQTLLRDLETGDISSIDIDISSFGGGLSKYIEDTLSNYDDYAGVPSKIKDSNKLFTKETLKKLQEFIKTTKARPKERANSLLSEAKLIQVIEPDNELYLKTILKRYCNDMALNHMADYSPKEVIRFFYTEASLLEIEWKHLISQVVFYFKTYNLNYNQLINIQMPSLDEKALDDVLRVIITDSNNKIWNNILDMFIWNDTITKHLSKKLFSNDNYKKQSLKYLKSMEIDTVHSDFDGYVSIWNKAREKRKREYQQWFNLVKNIVKINNLEHMVIQINNDLQQLEKIWLTSTDNRILSTISEINKNLDDYLTQKTFDDKDRNKNYILTEIGELLEDIKKFPTKFSYEGYKPLLESIEKLLKQSFANTLKSSTPDINVSLLGESVVVNKNSVSIQFSITNNKHSSPISNVEIQIMENNNVKFISGETKIYESIRGGDEKIIKLDINVSDSVILNLVTDIGIIVRYNTRANDKITEEIFQIPIRLYTSDKFEKIVNPYAPLAEGGPVKDKSMFYGRDEYIENIVESLLTPNPKSIIIYGQKRSGKSSVLYHLKSRLKEQEKAFCIDFSIGDIIEDLCINNATFFYQILSKIEEELEFLEYEGIEKIPNFAKPTLKELQESPTLVFYEALNQFRKNIQRTAGWENKRLIILIDEFTYIYTSILKNEMSPNFMKTWKAFIEKNYFSAVLIGQDVAPKFKQKYSNEFGVTEDKRLTYLTERDAMELIEKPIWDKDRDGSRYIGGAIPKVLEYTACSPYYLQMFCARIVDYMNRHKAISVTESDIEEIANSFIDGSECLSKDKFDNLFTAGDADVEVYSLIDVENILILISKKSHISSCSREDIFFDNIETKYVDQILEDLKTREVIEQKNGFYNIKVGLFRRWLLKQI